MTVLLVPIINTLAAILFAGIWVVGTLFLYSVGDIQKRSDWPIANVKWEDSTRKAWFFNLFAILWILAFILSAGDFIIAAAGSIWYFNQGQSS
jgi:solute carrier family 44 (choline transporter-like protein), member 2/4/5